jgi:tetratricopeptide (TPR) repeat protein/predicted Ser/Thr protein kinase
VADSANRTLSQCDLWPIVGTWENALLAKSCSKGCAPAASSLCGNNIETFRQEFPPCLAWFQLLLLSRLMERNPKTGQHPDAARNDAAGVRTPSEGGSSSSDANLPSDAPTLVDFSPDFTKLIDASLKSPVTPPKENAKQRPKSVVTSNQPTLEPGMLLAERYEIVQILGQGGMGAVYKATDVELNRTVALKVIRPDLARDKAIVDRFKQELLLAHQVTHRNVIRIYDLSEADGMKFITMEYVEGENLLTLIHEKKKFAPAEAVEVMLQVCRALEAAHTVGVIHRDLKPQNIMRDTTGRIVVMDFGLARTLEGGGMTQSGALVGTMEYMSPEQALGKPLDQRSDIFALGLIFYEMLTGQMPFKADSTIASLIRRTQERVSPVSDHDNTIPRSVSNIVTKCLERDLDLRYKTAAELLADLETWQGKRAGATLSFEPKIGPWGRTIPWPWITVGLIAVILGIGGYRFRDNLFQPSAGQTIVAPAVSLAILPFRNASGDPSFDWLGPSLADMLTTDVGQSAHLRTVSPDRLHQVLQDLHIAPNTSFDPTVLRRVAEFSTADVVVFGQYARFGGQVRIDATLLDLKNNRTTSMKADAASEKDIPAAFDKLADSVRQNLALSQDVLKELKASSYQPTSTSSEALRDYNQGIGLLREGKNLEAQKHFEAATKKDVFFALAFSKLAQTYSNLGYDAEAERAAQKAVNLSQNLPEAEKYLLLAIQAQISKNFPAAIKAYATIAKAAPENADVQSALAALYEQSGDFAKAGEYNQEILKANPKDINATLAMGRLAIKSDNAQGALDPLNRALSLSIQLDNQEQKAATLHAMAVAYRMLNRPQDSLRDGEDALTIWRSIGQKRGTASSLNEIARAEVLLGKNKEALENFQEALQIRRDIGDKRGLGDTLIDLGNFYDDRGNHDQALNMYKESLQIERDIGNERLQAACLNNIADVYFAKGQYEDARTYYLQVLQLREKSKAPDIVEAVHNLAETSVRMGDYDQAFSQYMRALELRRSMNDTRGAAIESYTLGMVLDYQGRLGAAITSKQAALKTFQDLKDKTYWMAEILGGYAQALILAGGGEEAKSYLDDALRLSRELKNEGMASQTLSFQGDAAYYRGDSKAAGALYEQALQAANRSKEPEKILIAKISLAKVAIQQGRAQQAIATLRPLLQQAENLGLKYTQVECSVSMAEAMIKIKDSARARQELDRALLQADKLGLKPLSAKAHYLLATLSRASGDQVEALQHYQEALQLIDAMHDDPGADKILERSDVKTMYEEATRWLQSVKS